MKLLDLYQHLLWYYHNDRDVFDQWAKNTLDMWPIAQMSGADREKRSYWFKKSGIYAPESEVFECICYYLEQKAFYKLMFLLRNTEKPDASGNDNV